MGRDGVTRRGFFATIAAALAAWAMPRQTTLSAAVATPENTTIRVPPPMDLNAEGWSDAPPLTAQHYCFYDEGHRFHVWPNPEPGRTFIIDKSGVWELAPTTPSHIREYERQVHEYGLRHFHYPGFVVHPNFSRHCFTLVSEPLDMDPLEVMPDAPFTTEPSSGNIGRIMATYDPELGRPRIEWNRIGEHYDPRLLKVKAQKQHELAGDFVRDAYNLAGQASDHMVGSAEEIERAFAELNGMIDRWNAEPWKR